MRKSLIILVGVFSVFFLYSCRLKSKQPKIKVQVEIIDKLSLEKFKGSFYSVRINLINNTDSIVRFWVMSCSWQDNWIFNSDKLYLFNEGCDKNCPVIKELKPKQNITFNGIVCIEKLDCLKQDNINIGFIFVKEKEFVDDNTIDFRDILYRKKEKKKDITWVKFPLDSFFSISK
jgi:hypothetical protein